MNTCVYVDLRERKEEEILHSEELHDFCSSPNVIHVMNARRIRWADHVACMGVKRNS